jgi:hypothetical protein
MTKTPEQIVELYRRAQVDEDMDGPTVIGGNDVYQVTRVIKGIANLMDWELPPPMDCDEMEQYLRDNDREEDLEYIGVNSGCGQ